MSKLKQENVSVSNSTEGKWLVIVSHKNGIKYSCTLSQQSQPSLSEIERVWKDFRPGWKVCA